MLSVLDGPPTIEHTDNMVLSLKTQIKTILICHLVQEEVLTVGVEKIYTITVSPPPHLNVHISQQDIHVLNILYTGAFILF